MTSEDTQSGRPSPSGISSATVTPVIDTPLLIAEGEERVLIAADLHLGLEHELWLGGVSIPSQTEKILARLLGYVSAIKPDRLLILGDLKHNVPRTSWQERREVPEFLRQLSATVKVEIIPGNHDSNIADMAPPGVRVRSSSGFVLDGIGYFHGHTWPDEKIIQANRLIAAHLHPAIRLRDPLGHMQTYPVWVRAPALPAVIKEHYGSASGGEIIIVPAFNHLCGGLALNEPREDLRGPILSLANLKQAHLYLIDGIDLGLLAGIKAAERRSF